MKNPRLLTPFAFCSLLAFASAASAQPALQGDGTLMGAERLRVPHCGRQVRPVDLDVSLAPGGAWSIEQGATTYTGTFTSGPHGHAAHLTFDAASLATLQAKLESDASALCQESVTVDRLAMKAELVVSKRQTRAALRVRTRGFGMSASGHHGTGLYRLRALGTWTQTTD
jgi:hypothetical protein